MKILKQIYNIFLIVVLLGCSFFATPIKVSAKTLRDVKNEYEELVRQYNENQQKEKLTQEEINKIHNNVILIQQNIEKGQQDIITLNREIAELEDKMDEKDSEIKKILNFLQISEGENIYLEYAFGANSFTDFIYRMAVTEQLSKYNDKLIDEYKEMIETNKKRKEEISKKEIELKNQQSNLKVQLSKLESQISQIYEDYIGISASLEVQKEMIETYENVYHCGLDDDVSVCASRVLPNDTAFWRPTTYGYMSSNYGMRWHPTKNVYTLHTGVDIAVSFNTPVYSVAAGTVVAITERYNCGGNMIFIQHKVNGKYYTSVYMHLYSIDIGVGTTVTKNTIIGHSGGVNTPWDECSTGGHLHISMLNGKGGSRAAGDDYNLWDATYYASLIDPRTVINLPTLGYSYYDRTSRY